MILASYTASVTAATGEPDYRARAQILNAAADYEATVGNAAAQAILVQPRLALAAAGDTVPLVSGRIRWLHNALDPATGEPVGAVKISADLLGCSREWSWPLAASRGSTRGGDLTKNPLGYELDRGGPPPGRSVKIDVELDLFDYATPKTLTSRLVNGGVVRESARSANAEEHVLELSGAGYLDRYARRKVDLELAADHGLTHGQIAVLACAAAGVPADEILIDPALGSPRTRAVTLSCSPLAQVLKDVLGPIGYRPIDSREPRGITALPVFIEDDAVTVSTINRSDIDAAAGVTFEADASVATCARVTGTDPSARTVPATGTVTTVTQTETYETDRTMKLAVANQDASGTITATVGGGDYVRPGLTLVERVTVRQTYVDGCLVRTRTTREGWRRVESHRYQTSASADGKPYGYPVCYFFDTVPVKDDAQGAYRDPFEIFTVLQETIEEVERDAAGRELVVVTKVKGWGWPEAAIKARAVVSTTWESLNYQPSVKIQGNGTGRLFATEEYFAGPFRPDLAPAPIYQGFLEWTELTRTANECNEETGTLEEFYRLGLAPGLTRLYADGTESADASESGRLDETTRVTRISTGPTSRTEVSSGTVAAGKAQPIKPKKIVVQTGLAGALPNVPICDAAASEGGGTEFVVTVCLERVLDDATLIDEEGSILDLESPFVESKDEALTWAKIELEVEAAVRGTIPLTYTSPALDVGAKLVIDLPDWGYTAEPAIIETIETTVGDDGTLYDVLGVRFPLLLT